MIFGETYFLIYKKGLYVVSLRSGKLINYRGVLNRKTPEMH